jgi:hypothetical protein
MKIGYRGPKTDAFGEIDNFMEQHDTAKGEKVMKKLAKPTEKKSKDKYMNDFRQETVECYESTLVNIVTF